MSQTIQEKNKAPVLKAFDTLFNKRDNAAAGAGHFSPPPPGSGRTGAYHEPG